MRQYQLPEPDITSPNNFQALPSNFMSYLLNGAKSSALVESIMPGKSIGSVRL